MTGPKDLTSEAIRAALHDVKDPEIPVVSVVELGIVQSIEVDGTEVTVSITPTFLGCPALDVMRQEVAERVAAMGATRVEVDVVLDPPWTSDRITEAARKKMATIGLAPPPPAGVGFKADPDLALAPAPPTASDTAVACPFCGSEATQMENAFGPTICRSIHYCRGCQQSFEQFKAI